MTCPYCSTFLPEPTPRYCTSCGGDLQPATPAADPAPAALPAPAWTPASSASGAGGPRREPGTPWEQRDRLGLATALIETTKGVLLAPTRFFDAMPTTGGIGGPLAYGVLVEYVTTVVAVLYQFLWFRLRGVDLDQFRGTPLEGAMLFATGPWMIVIQIVLGPVFAVMSMFVRAGICHLGLLLVGGAKQGFEATLRVVCYSAAGTLLLLIPLCGQYAAGIYVLVLVIIGVSRAHGIGGGRATAGVLLPLALFLCLCCAAAIAIGLMAGFSAASLHR
jgi:hypothetical protein